MNGLLKIPMQFIILLVLWFLFLVNLLLPCFFNKVELNNIKNSAYAKNILDLENEYKFLHEKKSIEIYGLLDAQKENNQKDIQLWRNKLKSSTLKLDKINEEVKDIVKKNNPDAETNDKDYIFMSYVIDYLPHGIIGLLFAVMFSAAMSSTASELTP